MVAARQMGIVTKQAMQDGCVVVTGHWQKSISYQVNRISDLKVEMTCGSNGAERYFYVQEATRHPIEIGFHQVTPQLADIYQKVITEGLGGRSVTQNIASSNVDEFGMMAGF
jgi:hypothetical protein